MLADARVGVSLQTHLRLPTVTVKQQLQRPTTERVLLADLHTELWSHLLLLGNWLADQFTCIICTPTSRGVIMVKIVHIIIKFLRYLTNWMSFNVTEYGNKGKALLIILVSRPQRPQDRNIQNCSTATFYRLEIDSVTQLTASVH